MQRNLSQKEIGTIQNRLNAKKINLAKTREKIVETQEQLTSFQGDMQHAAEEFASFENPLPEKKPSMLQRTQKQRRDLSSPLRARKLELNRERYEKTTELEKKADEYLTGLNALRDALIKLKKEEEQKKGGVFEESEEMTILFDQSEADIKQALEAAQKEKERLKKTGATMKRGTGNLKFAEGGKIMTKKSLAERPKPKKSPLEDWIKELKRLLALKKSPLVEQIAAISTAIKALGTSYDSILEESGEFDKRIQANFEEINQLEKYAEGREDLQAACSLAGLSNADAMFPRVTITTSFAKEKKWSITIDGINKNIALLNDALTKTLKEMEAEEKKVAEALAKSADPKNLTGNILEAHPTYELLKNNQLLDKDALPEITLAKLETYSEPTVIYLIIVAPKTMGKPLANLNNKNVKIDFVLSKEAMEQRQTLSSARETIFYYQVTPTAGLPRVISLEELCKAKIKGTLHQYIDPKETKRIDFKPPSPVIPRLSPGE